MAVALVGAAIGGGLSLASSRKHNKEVKKQLKKTVSSIKSGLKIQIGQLKELGESAQRDFGLQQTQVRYKGLKDSASTSNDLVERNVAGNTAARIYNQSFIDETMAHNVLAKEAEESFINFGVEMENSVLRANGAIEQAQAAAAAATISPLQALTSAVGAGFGGYKLGSAVGSFDFGTSNSNFANPALQPKRGGV